MQYIFAFGIPGMIPLNAFARLKERHTDPRKEFPDTEFFKALKVLWVEFIKFTCSHLLCLEYTSKYEGFYS
jgi:hypothetical protein